MKKDQGAVCGIKYIKKLPKADPAVRREGPSASSNFGNTLRIVAMDHTPKNPLPNTGDLRGEMKYQKTGRVGNSKCGHNNPSCT